MTIEEERKTLKSTLDVDLNLSQHLMSTSQVNISCQHLMSIFQLDFPFLMPSISQYLEFNIYDCYFWVGFPISAVKYFSKLKFCIYDCTFGLDFPFPLLSKLFYGLLYMLAVCHFIFGQISNVKVFTGTVNIGRGGRWTSFARCFAIF